MACWIFKILLVFTSLIPLYLTRELWTKIHGSAERFVPRVTQNWEAPGRNNLLSSLSCLQFTKTLNNQNFLFTLMNSLHIFHICIVTSEAYHGEEQEDERDRQKSGLTKSAAFPLIMVSHDPDNQAWNNSSAKQYNALTYTSTCHHDESALSTSFRKPYGGTRLLYPLFYLILFNGSQYFQIS